MEQTFHSIMECWPESTLHIFSDSVMAVEPQYEWELVIVSAFLLLLSIVFFKHIVAAVSLAFPLLTKGDSVKRCMENQYLTTVVNMTALLAFVVIDMAIYIGEIAEISFYWLPLALLIVMLARCMVMLVFKLLRGRAEMWGMVKVSAKLILIATACCLLPIFIVHYLAGSDATGFIKIYLLSVLVISYIFHITKSSRIIISSGCSIFFWFLYLCVLEFLPLGVFISVFVTV